MYLIIALTGAKQYIRCNEIHYFVFYGNGMYKGTNWALFRLELSNLQTKMLTLLLIYHRDGDVNFDKLMPLYVDS